MEKLSVKECLSFGWKTFWARPWLFVLAGVIAFAVNALFSVPEEMLTEASKAATGAVAAQFALFSLAFSLIGFVVSIFAQMGTTRFSLKAHDDVTTTRIRDLLVLTGFWRYLGASLLVFLAVVAGLILFIVPGVILAIGLSFTLYLCVEKGLGPVAAFKESLAITKGQRWPLFVLMLAIFGINILGLLALLVGLVVTIPVSMIATVHAYRVLSARHAAPADTEIVAEPLAEAAVV